MKESRKIRVIDLALEKLAKKVKREATPEEAKKIERYASSADPKVAAQNRVKAAEQAQQAEDTRKAILADTIQARDRARLAVKDRAALAKDPTFRAVRSGTKGQSPWLNAGALLEKRRKREMNASRYAASRYNDMAEGYLHPPKGGVVQEGPAKAAPAPPAAVPPTPTPQAPVAGESSGLPGDPPKQPAAATPAPPPKAAATPGTQPAAPAADPPGSRSVAPPTSTTKTDDAAPAAPASPAPAPTAPAAAQEKVVKVKTDAAGKVNKSGTVKVEGSAIGKFTRPTSGAGDSFWGTTSAKKAPAPPAGKGGVEGVLVPPINESLPPDQQVAAAKKTLAQRVAKKYPATKGIAAIGAQAAAPKAAPAGAPAPAAPTAAAAAAPPKGIEMKSGRGYGWLAGQLRRKHEGLKLTGAQLRKRMGGQMLEGKKSYNFNLADITGGKDLSGAGGLDGKDLADAVKRGKSALQARIARRRNPLSKGLAKASPEARKFMAKRPPKSPKPSIPAATPAGAPTEYELDKKRVSPSVAALRTKLFRAPGKAGKTSRRRFMDRLGSKSGYGPPPTRKPWTVPDAPPRGGADPAAVRPAAPAKDKLPGTKPLKPASQTLRTPPPTGAGPNKGLRRRRSTLAGF